MVDNVEIVEEGMHLYARHLDTNDAIMIGNGYDDFTGHPQGRETTKLVFGRSIIWKSALGSLLVPLSFEQIRCGERVAATIDTVWKWGVSYKSDRNAMRFSKCHNASSTGGIFLRSNDKAFITGIFHEERLPVMAGINDDILREIIRLNDIVEDLTSTELACPETYEAGPMTFERQMHNPVRYQKGVTYKSLCGTFEASFVMFGKNNFKLTRLRRHDGAFCSHADLMDMDDITLRSLGSLALAIRDLKLNKQGLSIFVKNTVGGNKDNAIAA